MNVIFVEPAFPDLALQTMEPLEEQRGRLRYVVAGIWPRP
jgi:hypothetical protein